MFFCKGPLNRKSFYMVDVAIRDYNTWQNLTFFFLAQNEMFILKIKKINKSVL